MCMRMVDNLFRTCHGTVDVVKNILLSDLTVQ